MQKAQGFIGSIPLKLLSNNITVIGLDWVGLDYEFHDKYEGRCINYSRRDQVSFLLLQDGENP